MFINGKLQDVVYMTDGVWNIGYDPTKTILKSFQVKNDSTRQLSEDYPVFRNVAVEATTAEFVSVYKVLRGAGVPQNLTAYKTLAFSAKGGTNLRIVLVKNSITNYQNQYSYSMPLASELSSYNISLDDFKSASTTDKIDANDVTTVVFSFETTSGKTVTINTLLSEVAFSKKTAGYLNSQEAAQIYVFPNPINGSSFTAGFNSTVNTNITVQLTEAASGKVIFTKITNAIKGDNIIPVKLSTPATPSVYLLSITGKGINLKTGKVIVQ
jgi:hypothetical protein